MSPSLSPFTIVGVSLAMVAMVFHVVGVATPSWVEVEMTFPGGGQVSVSYGLWVECHTPGTCTHLSTDYLLQWYGDWMFACRVLSVAGLAVGLVALVMEMVTLVVPRCKNSTLLAVVAFLFTLAAGVCILTSALTFASHYHKTFTDVPHLNWSFAVDATGGFTALVAALMLLFARVTSNGWQR